MTVRFRFDLTGTGWAECSLEIGGQSASISASYLSDALDDLSRATVAVLAGQPRSEAVFEEEPGEYRWVFNRVGERRLRVRLIDRVTTPNNATETVLVDSECQAKEFGEALLAELRRLVEVHGEQGYLEKWVRFPFPHSRIAQLSALTATSLATDDVMQGFQCCFCGARIAQVGDDPVTIELTTPSDINARQDLWAHALCLHRGIRYAPLHAALPGELDVLPLELALKSASPSEVVLPFRDANQALETFARLGWRLLGWEGWIRTPDGAIGHEDAPQGTSDLSELTKEQAVDLCRRTMHTAHSGWRGSVAHPGAELLFCISVAAP